MVIHQPCFVKRGFFVFIVSLPLIFLHYAGARISKLSGWSYKLSGNKISEHKFFLKVNHLPSARYTKDNYLRYGRGIFISAKRRLYS
jgi:hypothetical protein